MTTETLTFHRSDDLIVLISRVNASRLPTVVIPLGPDLTVEIDPAVEVPVRIATDNYPKDRGRLEAILGPDTIGLIDAAGQGRHQLPFTPGPGLDSVYDLAARRWDMDWNPLPLDPGLLALDLLRAEHQAITLTGELPEPGLARTAYPAAQTLQRLLDADAISPALRDHVRDAIEACEANTPLSYTDTTPYALPLPLPPEIMNTLLEPAPAFPGALATGSPDWRLTGHGPAATAENSITVIPHATNASAITISVPVKPHTQPEKTPIYQALITDPATGTTVATTTIRHAPGNDTYVGHTTPRRPITPADLIDIRHPSISAPPATGQEDRLAARTCRDAVRTFVEVIWEYAQEMDYSLAFAAAAGRILQPLRANEVYVDSFVQFLSQDEYVRAAKSGNDDMIGNATFGEVAATWTIDANATSIHIALDAPREAYPELSLVRIRITDAAEAATYFMVFYAYDDEFVVSELTAPLPPGQYSIAVDASPVRVHDIDASARDKIARSISGCGVDGVRAWTEIARTLPGDDPLAAILLPLLGGDT